MSSIRVIRAADSAGLGIVPGTVVTLGDGYIDYVTSGTEADIPDNAIYAALLDDAGQYKAVIQAPASYVFTHHFAGWDPLTWPYPS